MNMRTDLKRSNQMIAGNAGGDLTEQQKIARAEEEDRVRYIQDIVSLMRSFENLGISEDVSAQLASTFYNDPRIRKRRENRRKNKNN